MAKSVSLTIGERVAAVNLLNEGKFSNAGLAVVLEDIKRVAVTAEEWKEANLRKTPTDEALAEMSAEARANAKQTWQWDEKEPKEIELGVDTVEYLRKTLKDKSDKSELTLADATLLTLGKKLD